MLVSLLFCFLLNSRGSLPCIKSHFLFPYVRYLLLSWSHMLTLWFLFVFTCQDVFDLPFHMARDQIEESLRTKMASIKVGTTGLRLYLHLTIFVSGCILVFITSWCPFPIATRHEWRNFKMLKKVLKWPLRLPSVSLNSKLSWLKQGASFKSRFALFFIFFLTHFWMTVDLSHGNCQH